MIKPFFFRKYKQHLAVVSSSAAIVVFLLIGVVPIPAAEPDAKSVEDAKRALGKSTTLSRQFPWYSSEQDDSQFLPFPKEKPKKDVSRESREWGRGWIAFFKFLGSLEYGTLTIIIIVVLAVVLLLAWYIVHRNRDLFKKLWRKEEYQERRRRIETLPEEARDMFDDLIGAAQRAFEEGKYRNALIYYFSHQLVWLDMHQLIRMHKGKTNHEYARELKTAKDAAAYYENAMALFESVYYGDHPITRLMFLGVWEHRREFSAAVKAEKQRRDEKKQQETLSVAAAPYRGNLTLKLDMPDSSAASSATPPAENLLPLLIVGFALLSGTAGCQPEVETGYIPPLVYDQSVNGISVFYDMTARKGHTVRSGTQVNSYAKKSDVLIWFARKTGCPGDESVKQIEDWLRAKPNRTFVYVGRAFESTYDYWDDVEKKAPLQEDKQKIASQKFKAKSDSRKFLDYPGRKKKEKPNKNSTDNNIADNASDANNAKNKTREEKNAAKEKEKASGDSEKNGVKNDLNNDEDDPFFWANWEFEPECCWFTIGLRKQSYAASAISGDSRWTDGIDAAKLHLTYLEDWTLGDDVAPLLIVDGQTAKSFGVEPEQVAGQAAVSRKKVGKSQAIFVSNAGFLLNYPLVNREHRKLAGRLIAQFGAKKRIFVYVGSQDVNFERNEDFNEESPHVLLTLLHIYPLSIILCHVIALCAAFCFYKWPILGRPKKLPELQVADFGKHIDAYAKLLAEAKDDFYVLDQLTDAYNRQEQELKNKSDKPTL
ncbi:MAG: DUF4129 domain-containing protein [Planctomycetaceae bacterium]|jgi:hypothetical protein|nr:DUF4129 domain-containing protein [Planctomycetaceae bacterium]